MIGMTVREPGIAAAPDVFELRGRDLMGHPPAAKKGAALDPGIGGQDRVTVETGDRGITDCLETDHGISSSATHFKAHPAISPAGPVGASMDSDNVPTLIRQFR